MWMVYGIAYTYRNYSSFYHLLVVVHQGGPSSVDQNVILLEYYDNYFSWFWKLSEKYTDSK